MLKLSSTSEPPKINMPSPLGKWHTDEKYRNLLSDFTSFLTVHFFLKKSN